MLKEVLFVTAQWVLSMMNGELPTTPWAYSYGESATAIAEASNADPLTKDADGPAFTSTLLVAVAKHESDFHPNAIGDHGASLGLFQIQPPTAKVDGTMLLVPRTAAPIAIDLIRTSFRACAHRPMEERLAWYAAGGNHCSDSPEAVRKSREMFRIAHRLYRSYRSALLDVHDLKGLPQ